MSEKLQLHITGMDCADCALKLEKGVGSLAGVESCRVIFTTAKMEVATTLAGVARKHYAVGSPPPWPIPPRLFSASGLWGMAWPNPTRAIRLALTASN